MKGYTDFLSGFLGAGAVATKPIGAMKYMDWDKVRQVVKDFPDKEIYAGLMEDWNNTSGLIFAEGEYYDGGALYGCSTWATPIVDIEGVEIECYKSEPNDFTGIPSWWGEGQEVLSGWEYEYGEERDDEYE